MEGQSLRWCGSTGKEMRGWKKAVGGRGVGGICLIE